MPTRKYSFFLTLSILFLPLTNFSVTQTQAAPIPVKTFVKDVDGVTVLMNPGLLKLQVCDARTVRVVYTPGDKLPATKSFVITREWKPVPFKAQQDAKSITLTTGSLRVVLNRATGALTFLDAAGHVLLAETADGGKTLTPTKVGREPTYTVQQVFQSPPDEAIYGLGQFQDGLWNWRGIPLELRQVNTQIAVPMMVSSKGYGLLWDNASLLDFNPADQQIPLDGSLAPATTGNQPSATEDLGRAPIDLSKLGKKTGTFTTGEAGEYAFLAKDGDRRGDFAIIVDGRQVAGVTNMWTPYALSARVKLPAHTTVTVGLRGGGGNAKLFARPLGNTTTFRSQMGEDIDYTFFYGPEFDDIIAGYRQATGAAPLWPKWAYGFWQCRERYSSQQQILDTVAEFRKRQIPLDLLVQDWQYWGPHGWGSYQWDTRFYPDPAAMIKGMHDQNVKFMISVWHNPHGTALEKLKQVNGMAGEWIDVFNPEARRVRWQTLDEAFFSIGTDAWWNDATEPGDPGEGLTGRQTAMGSGERLRNSYPLFAAQDVYEGQRSSSSAKRVVNLTRSAYPGMQRYGAAAWSGDINGDWETFKRQIPAGLNFSLTGIPYWTTDTGGFFHPGDQYTSAYYNELLARWFQWSTFCPILRIHGYQTETEMWKWLPETQKILLAYDELRYRMLPYNYSMAWKVTHEGYTFMRALPMDFRADARVTGISDQFMFGPAFLVHPVTHAMDNVQVPPPATIPSEFLHTPDGQPGIVVQYFEGTNFEKPVGTSIDPKVEHTWPSPPLANPPGGLTGFNNFSARWEGALTAPEEGEYEIGLEGDDGFRLWLDGKLVVEDWAARPALYKSTKITLRKGQVLPLKIEYYQGGGDRILRLSWRTPSQLKEFLGTKAGLKHAMATYLPAGANWYDFWTNERFTGGRTVSKNCPLDILPLYVRAGSIVPLGPVQQYANEKPADPIELRVYRGANGALDLYEDEGDNYNYENGTYATIPLRWDEKTQQLTLGARKGRFPGMLAQRTFHVVWVGRNHGAGIAAEANADAIVHYSGQTTIVKPARPS